MYPSFIYALRENGIDSNPRNLIELISGIEEGYASTLGELFLLSKATFVKKQDQFEGFQKAFFSYFIGIKPIKGLSLEGSIENSSAYQNWKHKNAGGVNEFVNNVFSDKNNYQEISDATSELSKMSSKGVSKELQKKVNDFLDRMDKTGHQRLEDRNYAPATNPEDAFKRNPVDTGGYRVPEDHKAGEMDYSQFSDEKLEKRLEQLLDAQIEKHEGGLEWIGPKGNGPYGHNGFSKFGIRVGGEAKTGTARKVLKGNRTKTNLKTVSGYEGGDYQEVLEKLKLMEEEGKRKVLNVSRTVRKAGKKGYVVPSFDKKEVDKMDVKLFIDNGGKSMNEHVPVVEKLFSKMRAQLNSLETFYFHNCIYEEVFTNSERTTPISLDKITAFDDETRIVIVGDAAMSPHREVNEETLSKLRSAFDYSVWLNPVDKRMWRSIDSIRMISNIFEMYELNPKGLYEAVEFLTRK